jgi:glycosyltransferase involved in cell wall biosynthesis
VINIIQTGGAEIQMVNLAKRITHSEGAQLKIISLKEKGNLPDAMLAGLNAEIIYLGLNVRTLLPGLRRLVSEVTAFKPDAIHTWMYHSNLILSLALLFSRYRRKVIWSVHHNDLSKKNNKLSTLVVSMLSAWLSHILKPVIVFVSERAMKTHLLSGYRRKNAVVIENAIDLEYFTHQADARERLIREKGLPENALLVGYFGRFDAIKNHQGFLQGMRMFFDKSPGNNVFVIMAGAGISDENPALTEMIKAEGLGTRVRLLGIRTDMSAVYSATDLCVLMSFNESFSLVLVEAICCGAVCIASAESDPLGILETGNILLENTPAALCSKLTEVVYGNPEPDHTPKSARLSIVDRFDIRKQAKKYMALYERMPLAGL